ncbi:hypothetical protein Tco_1160247, partial [Tanacetum coccineum]
MAPLPPREQRHPFLRYQGLEYTAEDIADFEERMRMEHRDDAVLVRWGQEMIELEAVYSGLRITHRGGDGVPRISTDEDFLGPPPSYTLIRDPVLRLCHRMMAHNIAGRSQAPEKSMAHISGGQFVARLAEHFGLLTAEILGGLTVAMGPERQPDVVAGTPAIAEDAHAVDEGDQAVLAPMQAPQQPPLPPSAAARTIFQRLGRLEEDVQGLRRDVGSLRGLVERLMTDQGRFFTWMISCMTQLMDASGLTYQAFDGTFRGSSPLAFQRRTRQRTNSVSTSAAQQDPQQPDP